MEVYFEEREEKRAWTRKCSLLPEITRHASEDQPLARMEELGREMAPLLRGGWLGCKIGS